jgi:uncharacterized integral membrane protein (TIGR00697 family)
VTTPYSTRRTGLLLALVGLNTALLVASNAGAAKIIALPGGLAASATVFSYALTFAFTDTISEIYGPREARSAVRIGFVGLVLSVAFFLLAIVAPPATFWYGQEAYAQTLGLGPRILLGGWAAYILSQHLDVWLFHLLKDLTGGRYLWIRNNVSTATSQLADTIVFITVGFYGLVPLLPTIAGQYLIKLMIAAFDTPLVYLDVAWGRRYGGWSTPGAGDPESEAD